MAVDPNTDTIEMKALFPNPDSELLPGAYVRVVFDKAVRDNVFAIPRDAVIRTAQGASVFVVGPDGVLETRPVRADTLNGREWLVSEGLRDGDRVVVSHMMSLRPGMKVRSAAVRPNPMPSNKPPCLISSYAVPFCLGSRTPDFPDGPSGHSQPAYCPVSGHRPSGHYPAHHLSGGFRPGHGGSRHRRH